MTCNHFRRARPLGTRSPRGPAGNCCYRFPVLSSELCSSVAGERPLRTEAVGAAGGAAMPRYYEDKPDGGACAGVKEDLGACLLQSDCVLQVARPTGRRGRRRCPGRPAVAVRRRHSKVAVLGAEPSSKLMNLGDVHRRSLRSLGCESWRERYLPVGFFLKMKPFRVKKHFLKAATLLGSECLFRLQRATN